MTRSLISVIIPVYNTQEYIIECLESVMKQTYRDYEVIIVNDGSTDDSEKLISDFINDNELENYHLINRENGGLCAARNTGLDHAKGEWIIFIDSDDWVEPTYFENMISADAKYHADYYVAGFQAYEIDNDRFDTWSNYTVDYGLVPQDLKELRSLDYVWARMYKRSIIVENSLRFDDRIKFCEDNAFNLDYVSVIHSFACVSEIGYTYRRGHSGAVSKKAITPYMRRYIGEHMYRLYDKIPTKYIEEALKENKSFSNIMWNAQLTNVVVDILENNTVSAKRKMNDPISKVIVESYHPNTKKNKLYHFFWFKSFFIFKLLVKVFYGNIDRIKKVKWLSHFLTH